MVLVLHQPGCGAAQHASGTHTHDMMVLCSLLQVLSLTWCIHNPILACAPQQEYIIYIKCAPTTCHRTRLQVEPDTMNGSTRCATPLARSHIEEH